MKNTSKVIKFLGAPWKLWGDRVKSLHFMEKRQVPSHGRATQRVWAAQDVLECIPSNILTQVTKELMTGDAVMDLILTEKELPRVVKAEGSLGYRDHKFRNGVQDPEMRDQGKKQDHKLWLQERKLGLFRDLLRRMPWETAPKEKGVQESWLVFKDHLCQAKKLSDPMCRRIAGGLPRWTSSS